MIPKHDPEIQRDLAAVLNRHSLDSACSTPDFILARYLLDCLEGWQMATIARDQWWGHTPVIPGRIVDE